MKKRDAGYQIKEKEHFDRLAESTGEIWWGSTTPAGLKRLERRADLVSETLKNLISPVILELGCGTGSFTECVLRRMASLRLLSCDISTRSVETATGRCLDFENIRFCVADLTSMPYAANTFDAVIGNSVLHHLPIEVALQECLRVLKPGGAFFFFEPNMLNPQVAIEKNIRFIGKWLQNTEDETAFFRWSLATQMQTAGFDAISICPFDFLHPIVPNPFIALIDHLGQLLEKTPVLKEISGSLIIKAIKPETTTT